MPKSKQDVLQGSLTLLILQTLTRGPLHGYAIAQRIEAVSEDLLRVEEGSLYPALHRLEQEGFIQSDWALTDSKRRARFYTLTPAGQRQLQEETASWQRLTLGVNRVLSAV